MNMQGQNALLEVKNLSVGISRPNDFLTIIDNCSFSIATGEIVALVGESGCGKSITSLSVSRLLPPAARITGGEMLFYRSGGEEKTDLCLLDEKELCQIRGKEIAMIFQEPRQSLNPLMRIGSQIAETLQLHNGKAGKEKTQAEISYEVLQILRQLNFPNPEKITAAYPHQLSGGMCQRVMIAIAAICRPKLLIADEPTSSLDSENQNNIIELLAQINREFGSAVLFISHDLSLARRFSTRTLVMQKGRIIDEGISESMFSSPANPYTAQLVAAASGMGKHRSGFDSNAANSSNAAKPFISVRDLSCSYISRSFGLFGKREEKPVLKSINLDIAAGEIFGLAGESGGGKSTLARCILGLVSYSGDIFIDGQLRQNAAAKPGKPGCVQMVFQEPGSSLSPTKKIGWLLEEPLVMHRIGTPAERERMVDNMLNMIGLEAMHKTRLVRELSGGQKQRACIGRALMLKPKMLIADEATSALDVFSGSQILNLFSELRKSLGLTILFISHNMEATEKLCDRFAIMRDGKLQFK